MLCANKGRNVKTGGEHRSITFSAGDWEHTIGCNVVSPLLALASVFVGAYKIAWLEKMLWDENTMVRIRVH